MSAPTLPPLRRTVVALLDAALTHGPRAESTDIWLKAACDMPIQPAGEDCEIGIAAIYAWRREGGTRWRAVVVQLRDLVQGGGA
jgi:hypothetical protein